MSRASSRTASRPAHCADYVAFTGRAPFALDAYQLGFAPGIREDYRLRQHRYPTLDLPVYMLDNDFRDPDPERFAARAREVNPRVAVVGDAVDAAAMRDLVALARDLQREDVVDDPVVVPKSVDALDVVPTDMIVGYPVGYSDRTAPDYSRPGDWAGRRVHVLGGTPPTAWRAIQDLTGAPKPGESLAAFGAGHGGHDVDVVGLDYNGIFGVAQKGEFWHRERPHWRRADDLSLRGTVRRGLQQIRAYWRERGVWPAERPVGPVDAVLDDPTPADVDVRVCPRCGRRPDLEAADTEVVAYDDGQVRAFCGNRCRQWAELHDGLVPLDPVAASAALHESDRRREKWVGPA